jgi:hypothetical protein
LELRLQLRNGQAHAQGAEHHVSFAITAVQRLPTV